jgi:mono/diheme cytochrome c family protein
MHDDMHDRGPTMAPGEEASGADVYAQNCARCHGADGERRGAPPLVGVHERLTEDEVRDIVREGPGLMPAFEGTLSPEAIDAVVDYVYAELSTGA